MSSALIPYVLSSLLFFPYLPFSLKAEYVFVLLAILPYLFLRNFKFNKEILILSFCLISTLPFVLLTSFHSFETGLFASPLTMFARLALPGAMLISFSFALCSAENVFEHTIRAITISGSILAAVAIASLIFPNFSTLLWPWIINEESSVWSQSMNLGRVPGLFNQPLEAGLFYSIALFASVIGFKLRSKIVISDYVFLILIFIGGIITLS
ncbi:MAG: hypothetical protein Q8R57_00275, partial [Bacteroidota bacterium]|nr:hypothetical protein [Bacteroidota bacterium]